jgi:DNA adenine methylase
VLEYATGIYEATGIEMVILDCIGFIRHFLHFFHRHRVSFLDHYESLVLNEPTSSVGQALKEAFLSLKKVALADH